MVQARLMVARPVEKDLIQRVKAVMVRSAVVAAVVAVALGPKAKV
jgi:hypothetical protein